MAVFRENDEKVGFGDIDNRVSYFTFLIILFRNLCFQVIFYIIIIIKKIVYSFYYD